MVAWGIVQREHFPDDIRLLEKELPLTKPRLLVRLKSFLKENPVLRLGGRLQCSKIQTDDHFAKSSHFT